MREALAPILLSGPIRATGLDECLEIAREAARELNDTQTLNWIELWARQTGRSRGEVVAEPGFRAVEPRADRGEENGR